MWGKHWVHRVLASGEWLQYRWMMFTSLPAVGPLYYTVFTDWHCWRSCCDVGRLVRTVKTSFSSTPAVQQPSLVIMSSLAAAVSDVICRGIALTVTRGSMTAQQPAFVPSHECNATLNLILILKCVNNDVYTVSQKKMWCRTTCSPWMALSTTLCWRPCQISNSSSTSWTRDFVHMLLDKAVNK